MARPQNLAECGEITSPGALDAAVAWAIVKNRPFVDGNKRAALAALQIFLRLNGFELNCTEVEETAMILGIASGQVGEQQWSVWVEKSMKPVDQIEMP